VLSATCAFRLHFQLEFDPSVCNHFKRCCSFLKEKLIHSWKKFAEAKQATRKKGKT